MRVPVPECFAVVSLLKSLRTLHQSREHGRGLALIDAPRRALAALGRNEGIAVLVLPVRVCRRLLHILLGSDLDIRRHVSPIARCADRLPCAARLPYGMADCAAVRLSHNAADLLIPCDRPRIPCILKPAVLYISRNAAALSHNPADSARIADILKSTAFVRHSHNTADGALPFDLSRIPCVLNTTAVRPSHNAADHTPSVDRPGV